MSTSKDKTIDDIWGENEDWVDDDFDVAEVINEIENSKEEGDNESDWDDYDSNDEIETNEKLTSNNNTNVNNKWSLKKDNKKNEFRLKNNKDKSHSINTIRFNKNEGHNNHNEKMKPRRLSNNKDNNNDFSIRDHHNFHNNYDNDHYQNYNHNNHNRSHSHNYNHSHNSNHNFSNNETFHKKKNSKEKTELDELNTSFARLMPINGWKPGDDDIEDYASDNEEDQFAKRSITQHIRNDGKFNNNNKNKNTNTNININKKLNKDQPRSSTIKNENLTNKNDESVHRIHYSEEKHIPKAPAALIKKEIETKKSHILESKWANQSEKKDNRFDDIKQSREYYRQKKISNKLDWDNGIKGSIEDYEKSDDDEDHGKRLNNNDNNSSDTKHEHFTYENSSKKKEDSQSEPTTRPTTSNSKAKARPSTTLSSMWA